MPYRSEESPKARELLQAFLDYLLDHGAGTALRPAAAALGTSARMLLHYFGSKEQLLVAAVAEFHRRQLKMIADEVERHPPEDTHHHVMAFWRSYAPKERRKFLLLLLELWVTALRSPEKLPGFLEGLDGYLRMTTDMLVASGVPRARAEVSASVYLAAMRGFMLDLLTTGDETRIDAAVERVAGLIEEEIARVGRTGAARRRPTRPRRRRSTRRARRD